MRPSFFSCVAFLFFAQLGIDMPTADAQSVVRLRNDDGRFQLTRNGKPFFVKGAGGETYLELLSNSGANSIRTWGADDLDEILEDAQKNGLTVCVGMWLGHPRHGFDYQNQTEVIEQLESCLATVRKYKDHPAVLMWGIGNEMEGEGTNPAVWYAVNHIAREVKRIDPNHPTMTVIAELGDEELKLHNIERFCPDIDIIGINSYGGIETVGTRFEKSGVNKPYIVTEHGPIGPWETEKTFWGSPIEQTSTEKAIAFANGYKAAVSDQPGRCLGSYAFMWGNKQETTATWFGMLLPDGIRLAAVDVMSEAWTGVKPKNVCPVIESMELDRTKGLKPGEEISAVIKVRDPDGDPLKISWVLRSDAGTIGEGGDAQESESIIENAVSANGTDAKVTVPEGGGGYRLFAYVFDGQGGAAVANVPFHVAAMIKIPEPDAPSKLPYVVYADGTSDGVFVPAGYMGNTTAITMKPDSKVKPHSGETCLEVSYSSTSAWGGVLWQSPPEDWDGLQPGGANLTGATHLEFWARGAQGGEVVNFLFGVLDGNQPYRDTAKAELSAVKLSDQWKKYSIPLTDMDLRRIKTGFGWSLAGQAKPITFFLDDIRYVGP